VTRVADRRVIAAELVRRRRALGHAIALAEELCKRCAVEAEFCEELADLLLDAAELDLERERLPRSAISR
jgi:hypothetical protein